MQTPMTRPVSLLLAASVLASGCASLTTSTQKVHVVSEPAGAQVAVLEEGQRTELGAAPVDYQRSVQAYRCSKAVWLLPLATALGAGGAGFGIAWATTKRNDAVDSGWNNGAIFAAVGLAVGIAVAAECWMKDGVSPGHKDVRLLVEGTKDGHQSATVPLSMPSQTEELKLVLPPLAAPASAAPAPASAP